MTAQSIENGSARATLRVALCVLAASVLSACAPGPDVSIAGSSDPASTIPS
ncbi:MAG: hypothetical protein WDM79_04330 [Terricaulis sp.]